MSTFVITGASGGGKSTILQELAKRGFRIQPEIGREIVRQQLAMDGHALPWRDSVAFRDLLFQRSLEAYEKQTATAETPVFFDRSFIEAIAYSRILKEPLPSSMEDAAQSHRFDDPVFACPPWEKIFVRDEERQHDFEFALKDYDANVLAYRSSGYQLVEVPMRPVSERADFIVQTLLRSGYNLAKSAAP